MENKVVVVLERKNKRAMIVLRESDYTLSVRFDRGNNAKMYWGSGAMWHILNVIDYDVYMAGPGAEVTK